MANSQSSAPLRWAINKAASEFGIDRRTLERRLAEASVSPGRDRKYSTGQICAAVFGDMDSAKLRRANAEADLAEMDRNERAKKLISADIVQSVWTDALSQMRAIVMAADLPKLTRTQLIKQLKEIPLSEYKEPATQDSDDDLSPIR